MTFSKKNTANNAECGLQFGFDESASIFFLEGNYGRFPTSNFIVEVSNFDENGDVIARENIFCTSRSGNQVNVDTRAYEPVPINDEASSNIQQALEFAKTNSVVKVVWSKAISDEIQDELVRIETDKLDKAEYLKSSYVYGASSGGTDDYAISADSGITSYNAGQVFRFLADVANTGPATLNVNSLGAKTIKKANDQNLSDGDIEANQIVEVVYNATDDVFEMTSQVATLPTVDINGLPEETIIDDDDEFIFYDESADGNKKIKSKNIINLFGDGSDGDVIISSNSTLIKDMYYNNLTINSGITLNPNGYRIFVRGTLLNNGTIARNGNNGSNGSDGNGSPQSGGAGGAALQSGTLGENYGGAAGGNVGYTPYNGYNGTDSPISYGTNNGAAGGNVGYYSGGSGGITTQKTNYNEISSIGNILSNLSILSLSLLNEATNGIGSAGGGGGSSSSNNGSGGGGGGNGGIIFIKANIFNNQNTIEAIGGNGGNGGNGRYGYNSSGGGGGGGGSGGIVFIACGSNINTGTISVTGGTGGAGGVHRNTGVDGTAGGTGADGEIIIEIL